MAPIEMTSTPVSATARTFSNVMPPEASRLIDAGTILTAFFISSTGMLSSMLDNAPTYLGFLSALLGTSGAKEAGELLVPHAPGLLAISIGAVFFGAATYIGNGPNFMVKAVAD